MRYHTLVLTGNSSYISGNINSPFIAKNAFVTAYLLESSLAWFKKAVHCFQTISWLLSFKQENDWISSAACLSMKENKNFTNVFT